MSDLVKEITAEHYEATVGVDTPTLLDFWAPWCAPCRAIAPILESLADEFRGKVAFYKINVDEAQDLTKSLSIRSIPALFIIKKGEVVRQFGGLTSKDKLKDALNAVTTVA